MSKPVDTAAREAKGSFQYQKDMEELKKKADEIKGIERRFKKIKSIDYDEFMGLLYSMTGRVMLYASSEFCDGKLTIMELKKIKSLLRDACNQKFLIEYDNDDGKMRPVTGGRLMDYLLLVRDTLRARKYFKDRKVPVTIKSLITTWWSPLGQVYLETYFREKEFLPQTLMRLERVEKEILKIKSDCVNKQLKEVL